MFIFRGNKSREASPIVEGEHDATAPSNREFFAFKAARFIGGAARQVGAKLSKAVGGQTVEALQADAERRACGSREGLTVAISDWARLLSVSDDTPRYESREGGQPLTFRAAFLQCRAFELVLSTVDAGSIQTSAVASSDVSTPASPLIAFLRAAALTGGEAPAAKLPELFSKSRNFPDCRRYVQDLALILKADAREEQMRSERTEAGKRAEEIRSGMRGAHANGTADMVCQTSYEAVQQYSAFRRGLAASVARLSVCRADRLNRLHSMREALQSLHDDVIARKEAAVARKEDARIRSEAATSGVRDQLHELRSDVRRADVDQRVGSLEDERRRLQIQLEETSQALAAKRDARLALLQRREEAVAAHRRHAQAVEQKLMDLRPGQFHRVIAPRADAMTEGEIIAGLVGATSIVKRHAEAAKNVACKGGQSSDMSRKREAVRTQGRVALREHAKLELARLDAASAEVDKCVVILVDAATARATRRSMGLNQEAEAGYSSFSDFREVKRLRRALNNAEAAWSESASLWGGGEGSWGDAILSVLTPEDVPEIVDALEAGRGRLAQSLVRLQQADPVTYEMALRSEEGDGEGRSADVLPHGWEAHTSPEGHIFYYNAVSKASQWELPNDDAAVSAGWRLCQAEGGQWFYHNPYNGAGVWWPELPSAAAAPSEIEALRRDAARH